MLFTAACSEGSDDPQTGSSGSGGTSGGAGKGGGTGGSAGSTGGSAGSGGSSGSAGSGGTAGQSFTRVWNFAADVEGWTTVYSEPISVRIDPTHVTDDGSPEPGSLGLVSIPFSAREQKLQVGVELAAPVDLTGKVVTAKVKLVSGLTASAQEPAGAKLYTKSSQGFVWADGGWTNLVPGEWVTVKYDPAASSFFIDTANDAGAYNPAQVRQIGLELGTGSSATNAWTTGTIRIDTVGY